MEKAIEPNKRYLIDGQEVHLIGELHGLFVVQPILLYDDLLEGEIPVYGSIFHTSEIFEKPPVKIFNEKIQTLQKQVDALQELQERLEKENRDLKQENRVLSCQTTDIKKMIYRRDQLLKAKTIHYFIEGQINPAEYPKHEGQYSGLNISISYSLMTNGERIWATRLREGDNYNYNSHSVDPHYGLLLDISSDELHKLAKERAIHHRDAWKDYVLETSEDKYLDAGLKRRKRKLQKASYDKKIERKEKEIQEAREYLKDIKNKMMKLDT